jgi:hypothetical protein
MKRGMCGDEASKRGRDSDSERLRGLEINHQLELGGLLDRKVGRFLALEDSLSVGSSPTIQVNVIRAIRDQCAVPWWPNYCLYPATVS